MNICYFTV